MPTWGGSTPTPAPTWGGATPRNQVIESTGEPTPDDGTRVADTPWVSPYDLYPPIGNYVSENQGGVLCVSSFVGCRAWRGECGQPRGEGDCSHLEFDTSDAIVFEPHRLYFMSSNTPHETLLIRAGNRRTFLRITLDHRYDNRAILTA